jgi:hypothetical protein
MALPAFFWPSETPPATWPYSCARGVAMAPYNNGIVVADWSTPALWPFSGTAIASPLILASGTPGLSDVTADATGGVWTIGYKGSLWHQPASGPATLTTMPTGAVYVGCSASGHVLASLGTVLTSGGVVLGSWPTPAALFNSSGALMFAALPASGVGTMTTAGVTGLVGFPAGMTTMSTLYAGPSQLAVGGWQTAAPLAGAQTAVLNPNDNTAMMAFTANSALLWRGASPNADAWTQTQALTGLANNISAEWSPDGGHVLAASVASGTVQSISYAAGVIALIQTLSVSGACGIAMTSDSLHALVAQSGLAQLMPLTFTGTWITGAAVSGVPGISNIAALGASGAVATYSSGLAYLTLASGGWGITNTLALGYAPTALTTDNFGQVYAAGSGHVSVASSGGVLIGSGAWTGGAPTSIAVQAGRVLMAVPNDGLLYIYGPSIPGAVVTWQQQGSSPLVASGTVNLALSDTTLFAMTTGATVMWGFSGTPFVLTSVVSGVVAQRAGGSWTVTPLGIGQTPTALGYDGSGNLRVATVQNTQWSIATNGSVNSSGSLFTYPLQTQITPLGVSAMLAFASGMIGITSLPGTVMEIA